MAEEYFDSAIIKAVDKLLNNLDRFLFEPERPSLLHGDLWFGNFMSDEIGMPVLIDPAVYVGCNEADIAMTELFGGFDRRFYENQYRFSWIGVLSSESLMECSTAYHHIL